MIQILSQGTPMANQNPFADIGIASNPEPRCPCILVIDVSGSMSEVVSDSVTDVEYVLQPDEYTYRPVVPRPITRMDRVNEGLRAYQADLLKDPLASQRVEVSVVTFASTVQTVTPFVTANQFVPPTLTARGETSMGTAVLHAIDLIQERKRVYRRNGLHYYRPWIFLITDGAPTDEWYTAALKVREGERGKSFAFFAVGVEGANLDTLRQMSVRAPLELRGHSFREMFVWLSQSQRSISRSRPGHEDEVPLASPLGWACL